MEDFREVPHQLVEEFKEEHNLDYEALTSAKDGNNIDCMFIDLAKHLWAKN